MSHSPHDDSILKEIFGDQPLTPETFDSAIQDGSEKLKIVYFWGKDCPNCVNAKANMREIFPKLKETAVDWYSVDAYTHSDLATRFSLFGIPVFFFFKRGRLLGRITSFPTQDEFLATIVRHS